jgi:atypical dual specificity phosphatase
MAEMDEIYKITPTLYIGAYWPRINFDQLKQKGITAIVNLMEENLYDPSKLGFSYLHKGFPDNFYPPHKIIEEILQFIEDHQQNGKVLVHCAMGISRSGGIVVAYLLKKNSSWDWTQAIKFVNETKFISPAIEIRAAVLDYLESIEGRRRGL